MKRIFLFLSIIFSALVFSACVNSVEIGEHRWPSVSSTSTVQATKKYDGTVDHYSDAKGIHIRIPLNEDLKINKIELYEVSAADEILMASVNLVSPQFFYALDGSPCGQTMTEIRGEETSTVSANWHTNYFDETVTLDLPFVEPGKKYDFMLCLYEPEYKTGDRNTTEKFNEGSILARYNKPFSEKASSQTAWPGLIEASYNSETDKFTVNALDLKTLELPYDIEDDSDISLSLSAAYVDSHDSKRSPVSLPLTINPSEATENSILPIVEFMDDVNYGSDYKIQSLSGSLSYKNHVENNITDTSTADEKKAYYTKLYTQKNYLYNCPYISATKLPQTIKITDQRMTISVRAEEDSNIVSVNMPVNASVISIFRKTKDENDYFLAGTMTGTFVNGNTYTFPDYYAETGKNYTYYVVIDASRKSKSVSVETLSSMKYKPNAPEMTYEFNSQYPGEGVFTVITNPFTNKLPPLYSGEIDFVYGAKGREVYGFFNGKKKWKNFFESVFNFTLSDSDSTVTIPSNELRYSGSYNSDTEWDGSLIVEEPGEKSYKVTITAEKDSITYLHNYILKEMGSMPTVSPYTGNDYPTIPEEEPEDDNIDDINIEDLVSENGDTLYVIEKPAEGDYAEIRSINQNADGSVAIKVYLPKGTYRAELVRNTISDDMQRKPSAEFYFNILEPNESKEMTIIDFDVSSEKKYEYVLNANTSKDGTNNKEIVKSFEKSSEFYLQTLPTVNGDDDIEGDFVWNKLPEGYSLLNDKEIRQIEWGYAGDIKNIDGKYLTWEQIKKLNLYVKRLDSYYYEWTPKVYYKCVEVTGQDKYYKDEYENETEIEYEEDSSELYYYIYKVIRSTFSEKSDDVYYSLIKEWRQDSSPLSGNYEVTGAKVPFICEYGIMYYEETNLDHVSNKTFTIEKEEPKE